jgi:DNA invertase Pin-like site-specific DNA recombinase
VRGLRRGRWDGRAERRRGRPTCRYLRCHTYSHSFDRAGERRIESGDGQMRVVGYVRVSTEKQAEDGLGLAVQEKAVRRWAREHGHRLVGIVRDEGVSGALPTEERPGLAESLSLIANGKVAGLVVARLDRLARELTVQEAALAQVWKHEGRVFACDSEEILRDDPEDPMRTAMRQMMGVFGQLERAMIAARLRAGRRLKAERGGFAYGSPPFGYRAEAGELVAVDEEQAALRRIRQLARRGASLRTIARTLESEGHRPKRSECWHPQTLSLIISREGARGGPARIGGAP